jgi:FkbM family methyltransferase
MFRLRRLRWFRRLQGMLDRPVAQRRRGLKVHMMLLRDLPLIVRGDKAQAKTHAVFERVLRYCGCTHFFDIGASIGLFAWHALRVAPEAEVHLFEPDATNIALLKRTVASNKLSRVHLWEGAVGAVTGEIDFLVDDVSGATGSIKDHTANPRSLHAAYGLSARRRVKSISLDNYLDRSSVEPRSPVLKIDVEGAEREVLEGAVGTVGRYRPYIIVECQHRGDFEALRGLRYAGYALLENDNYLLVPCERDQEFRRAQIMPGAAPFTVGEIA